MAPTATRKKPRSMAARRTGIERQIALSKAYVRSGTIYDLNRVCRIYLRVLVDMVRCDGYAVILIDGDKAKVLCIKDLSKEIRGMEFSTDTQHIKDIMNTKRTIFVRGASSSSVPSFIPDRLSVESWICTPILIDGDVKGIIYLDSLKRNLLNRKDIEFTELLSEQMSEPLQQSIQYSKTLAILAGDIRQSSYNYHSFSVDIIAEINSAKKYQEVLSLIVLNVDWGKKYKKVLGRAKEDIMAGKLFEVLASSIRAYQKIYRQGLSEFLILLASVESEEATLIALRLQNTIQNVLLDTEKGQILDDNMTVSVGIATFPSTAEQADKLIEAAKSALYRAKESGGNRICFA